MVELESDRPSVRVNLATLLEVAIKMNLERLSVDLVVLNQRLIGEGFQWLAICNDHFLEVARLETICWLMSPF